MRGVADTMFTNASKKSRQRRLEPGDPSCRDRLVLRLPADSLAPGEPWGATG